MKNELTVLLITPVEVEFQAARLHFAPYPVSLPQLGSAYQVGEFEGQHHKYKIWAAVTGSGVDSVAAELAMLVQAVHPQLVILTGIARGIKDVKIGDVVIGTHGYLYESGVQTANGFLPRPKTVTHTPYLVEVARNVARSEVWKSNIRLTGSDIMDVSSIKVYAGPIASGNKVVKDADNGILETIRLYYGDTLALEMEAAALRHLAKFDGIMHINIRAISDTKEIDKAITDKEGYQAVAASVASGFVFSVLDTLLLPNAQVNTTPANDRLREGVEAALLKNMLSKAVDLLIAFDEKSNNMELRPDLISLKNAIGQYEREVLRDTLDYRTSGQASNRFSIQVMDYLDMLLKSNLEAGKK